MSLASSATAADGLHKGYGNQLVATSAAMVALSGVCVLGRLWSHIFITRHYVVEDVFIVLAWAASIAVMITFIGQNQHGLGVYTKYLLPQDIGGFLFWLYHTLWTYNVALAATKLSILFQYRRIFTTPRFQVACKVMLVILTLYTLAMVLDCVLICYPARLFWTQPVPGKCLDTWTVFIGNSVMNILTDIMVLVSPLPVLTNLHLPRRQKVVLIGVFATGGVVVIASIVRLASFIKNNGSGDFSHVNMELGTYSIVETAVGIIGASIPALKPLVIRIFPAFGSTRSGTRSQNYGTNGNSKGRTNADTEKGNLTYIGAGDDGDMPSRHGEVEIVGKGDGINVVTTTTISAKPGAGGQSSV